MRILVNATTCVVGGGIQVATTFIRHALEDPRGHEFFFAVSPQVMGNLKVLLDDFSRPVVAVAPSPAKPIRGMASRRKLRGIVRDFRPDLVYSVGSPSYMTFPATELARFADGWVSHPSKLVLRRLSIPRRLKQYLHSQYKVFWLRRSDFYHVQTTTAKDGLVRRAGLPEERIAVIPNSFSDVFAAATEENAPNGGDDRVVRLLVLANPFPHKNLAIIPEIAALLRAEDPEYQYRFVVTLPEEGKEVSRFWRLVASAGVESMIENAGRLTLKECPRWYAKSTIVFLPTLLETFSATYLEAMQMGRPIVTTDLDFAREICDEAAVYFAPLSARAAADAIRSVASDAVLRADLVVKGRRRLARYPSPEQKYQMQLDWIETVAGRGVDG
ncbi:MAG: glycosyltransferase [Pirellulales bacterium]|nr:glycosyltransferase [Pirellulales bacterium]